MTLIKKLIASTALVSGILLAGCKDYQPPSPNPKIEVIDAFPKQKVSKMKKDLSSKKLALALITNHDYNNAAKGMESMFHQDFSDLPDYKLYTQRTDNLEELFNNLRDYSKVKSIDALILAYHGNQNIMRINESQIITSSNAKKLFKDYQSVFSDDAIIILYSCSTGKGRKNIATALANTLNKDVIAPKFTLIPETDIDKNKRIGEFAPDKNKRISFDYENFKMYPQINFKDDIYKNSIATFSYQKNHSKKPKNKNAKKYFLFIDK